MMKLELHTNHDEALEIVLQLIQNEKTYDMAIAVMRQAGIDHDEVFKKDGSTTLWYNTTRTK